MASTTEIRCERMRFTVSDVRRLEHAGLVEGHVELIDGGLVVNPPHDPTHSTVKGVLRRRLEDAYRPAGATVRDQDPLAIGPDDEPEPDLLVVRGDDWAFTKRHPRGQDAWLVVEVAVSSLRRDRRKAALYARAGAPVYWIVDVRSKRLEVRSDLDPKRRRYRSHAILSGDQLVDLPGVRTRLRVSSLFP